MALAKQQVLNVTQQAIRSFGSSSSALGLFSHVEPAPKDPILGITENFLADTNEIKMNLGVGAYRDDNGQPVVLNCVREAEKRVAGSKFMEYLPIGGYKPFIDVTMKLAYGDDADVLANKQVAAVQALSGTGACRLMAEFQNRYMPNSKVLIPKPTWSNHHNIWRDAKVPAEEFRYYKPATRGLDYDGMLEDLRAAPDGSVVMLHACAHNPTGVDPTLEQWGGIADVLAEKKHFPFFDMAYQGFASGDCERDGAAIKMFLARGMQVALSQSYAKNMGMYGQRIGAFSIVCDNPTEAVAVESQIKAVARAMYSNPPCHGAYLVHEILSNDDLKQQWYSEVKGMAERIISMRTMLRDALESSGSKLPWNHVTEQIGMFCFSGMTGEMVDELAAKHSIYMTRNGRISMAGVTSKNVGRLAAAMHEVTSK